jgi:uncharacterized protein (DUF1810 family)
MEYKNKLERFLVAQETSYETALSEIKNGQKESHWMWYIFPQIAGLGNSELSKYYSIRDIEEASDYVRHPILGSRLLRICTVLADFENKDVNSIFGFPDNLKLQSCLTLFSMLEISPPIFGYLLEKYFNGQKDEYTFKIIATKNNNFNSSD